MPAHSGAHAKRHRQSSEWMATSAAILALWAAWLIHQGMATTRPPEPSTAALTAPVAEEQMRLSAPAPTQSPVAQPNVTQPNAAQPNAAQPNAAPRSPKPLSYSRPVHLVVPALRVNSRLTTVGITPDGNLDVPSPTKPKQAGWYRRGPAPGQQGTAVIVGHVDTRTGPAVFYGLATLKPMDSIEVTRSDGTVAVFTVDGIRVYSKSEFPAQRVLAPTGRPELRLVTCGGGYSKKSGYAANVVVYAHLMSTKRSV